MPKVQFIGRVLPATVMVAAGMPEILWPWPEKGIDLKFKVVINHSIINAECELPEYDLSYMGELIKRCIDLARALVDVLSFASGYGWVVTIDIMIGPDGIPRPIDFADPALPELCTAYSLARQTEIASIYSLVVSDASLSRALHDLVEVLTAVHVIPVNCGRVVDSIRRMITADPSVSLEKAWQAMHHALNVSRAYQKWISDQAAAPRHGDRTYVPENITTELKCRTWQIMNRFLEYRKRNNIALTAPDFPLLS